MSGQLQQLGGRLVAGPPKSDAGRRVIALDTTTIAALRTHQARQQAERDAAGVRWQDTGYVFTTRTGKPVGPDRLTRLFRRLVAASGLPPVTLHGLRHGAATLAQVSGVASAASFGSSCERRLPAEQRAALQQPGSRRSACRPADLGCHHPLASSRTMMQPVRLQRLPE